MYFWDLAHLLIAIALARFWLRGGFAPYVHGPFAESIWGGLTLLLGLAIVLFGTGCIIPWFTFKNMYRVEAAESGVGR